MNLYGLLDFLCFIVHCSPSPMQSIFARSYPVTSVLEPNQHLNLALPEIQLMVDFSYAYPGISRNLKPRRFGIRALRVFTDSTAEQTYYQDNKNNSAEYLLHHMLIIDQPDH